MSEPSRTIAQPGYVPQVLADIGHGLARLVRSPSHSRRADAARHAAQRSLLLITAIGIGIVVLMYLVDAPEIGLMPARGTPSLWPIRIVTDFGKSSYVLWTLFGLMVLLVFALPLVDLGRRIILIGYATRVQFLFFAVLAPVLVGEVLKGIIGRGRPFVGGQANPFNFSHFAWSEAYASLPSGHSITAFALAFAVSAVWPQLRTLMIVYALVIGASRLVLLAHHPSDVVAGALLGVIGAMAVRYWFAARRIIFTIHQNGTIVPLMGPSRHLL